MTLEKLARQINVHCKTYQYFWAYGLVKETVKLWEGKNQYLLCEEAQIMVRQCKV